MTFWSVFSLGWCFLVFARETHDLVVGEHISPARAAVGILLTAILMRGVAGEPET